MRNQNEDEIINILKDMNMEKEDIKQFMKSFHLKQWEKIKWILASHRSKLLSDVHKKQDQLYCIDFLTRKLKAFKNSKI